MAFSEGSFADKVRRYVRTIPKGRVRTYGQVAHAIGHPGAARAVGSVLRANFDDDIPCHRVIRADGDLGEYNRGRSLKKQKLQAEGAL